MGLLLYLHPRSAAGSFVDTKERNYSMLGFSKP